MSVHRVRSYNAKKAEARDYTKLKIVPNDPGGGTSE
jgi:hypothetical protein